MGSKVITWNGAASSNVPGLVLGQVTRPLLGTPQGVYKTVPGRAGGWFFPNQPGLRTVTVEGFIEGDTAAERDARVEDLADWLDYPTEEKLIIGDRPDVFYWATVDAGNDPEEWRNYAPFNLVWKVQPYSQAISPTTESWTSGVDTNHTWNPDILVPVYPVIVITPTNGDLTSFTLETNGDTLTFDGNITQGASVTVNGIVPVVVTGGNTDTELVGAFNSADAWLAGVTGTFPTLLPGITNNVHLDVLAGTATTINIDVIYRKAYRR